MANKYKGEVSFEAGGESFVLRFSANAIVALEDAFNKTIAQVGQDMMSSPENLRMADIKKMFCIALVDHYAESRSEIDDKKAGFLFARLGPVEATQIVIKAFTAAFEAPAGGQVAPAANPPQPPSESPRTGTGPAS